jgi:hypothetical protein
MALRETAVRSRKACMNSSDGFKLLGYEASLGLVRDLSEKIDDDGRTLKRLFCCGVTELQYVINILRFTEAIV